MPCLTFVASLNLSLAGIYDWLEFIASISLLREFVASLLLALSRKSPAEDAGVSLDAEGGTKLTLITLNLPIDFKNDLGAYV